MPGENVRFSSILLQDDIVRFLQHSIRNQRISQTYLFAGGRSIGKAQVARVFAATLQCLEPRLSPEGLTEACGKCLSCKRIVAGTHPDVTFISPLGKDIRIDQVRQVQEAAFLNAFLGKWKMFIFDEADRLNDFSANSLLKILEEAPAHVIFILLVENPRRLLPTIHSRSTTLFFRLPSFRECRAALAERFPDQPDRVNRNFSLSEGLLGQTLEWMETPPTEDPGPSAGLPEAQVRFLTAMHQEAEDVCASLRASATPEELLRRISGARSLPSYELMASRKDFLLGLAGAPALPAGFPVLFTRLFLDALDAFRSGMKKAVDRVLQDQKQQYSTGVLRELEDSMNSMIGELINAWQISFLEIALNLYGDIFRWQCTNDEPTLLNIDRKEDIMRLAKRWGGPLVRQRIATIGKRIERARRYVSPVLIFENFFADFGGAFH